MNLQKLVELLTLRKNNMEKQISLLEDIKKLLILQLVKGGVPTSSEEIGGALGVTGRTIRNVATATKNKKTINSKKN